MGIEVIIERSVQGERPEADDPRDNSSNKSVRRQNNTRGVSVFNLHHTHTIYFSQYVYDVINDHLLPTKKIPVIFRDHVCDSYGSCCTHVGISLFNWGIHKPTTWYRHNPAVTEADYEPTFTSDQVETAYTAYKAGETAFGRRRCRRDSRGRFL
jgi:hypothetical protein